MIDSERDRRVEVIDPYSGQWDRARDLLQTRVSETSVCSDCRSQHFTPFQAGEYWESATATPNIRRRVLRVNRFCLGCNSEYGLEMVVSTEAIP